ncbi:unnamed protein product [Rhizoctonia solani]|uniref:Fungal-type protein kinase domain-containing protein n=1 Tax=Rhizoctonia solani TaxID=456999 RepID=A0A8H3DVA8_9AGAM|nr:unnamed protein product [Rhizoctonia solani]
MIRAVAGQAFRETCLSGGSPRTLNKTSRDLEWGYVKKIRAISRGQEERLYTGNAPLLRLLNAMSEQIAGIEQEALVFRSGNNCQVKNPFTDQFRSPDIIVAWEPRDALSEIDYSVTEPFAKTWTELAAVGEVKVSESGRYQLTDYLQRHLQFHPELNGVLGFTARASEYALFYHDAGGVYRAGFSWEDTGPLYEFIQKLYTRPFRDVSMQIQDARVPRWATKIGDDIYLSGGPNTLGGPDAQAGPGQRRYTTKALDAEHKVVFIKDIWRDERRFFFEPLLLKSAHKGHHLCGLVLPTSDGYVPDANGSPIRTMNPNPPGSTTPLPNRFKMRMVTEEIGLPLEGVHSLRKFLCAMYDACVVQRNLYRKSCILHRDISDKNIMFAPGTSAYRKRNQEDYAEVKFVNQVLAKNKSIAPDPACLVIDLGNGADLTVKRGTDTLTERTGTPKFIARSVSSGELLGYPNYEAKMPPIEGLLADYDELMHTTKYQFPDSPGSATQSEVEFAHRLFHDAESTFWVIAWTLTRSIKNGSQQQTNPSPRFSQFFHTMSRHYPIPRTDDPRDLHSLAGKAGWEGILHPDLSMLAPMLAKMFHYIRPEWAYWPNLNPEHVHEALMRLLLAQILTTSEEVMINIGGRDPPPALLGHDPLPRSMTTSRSKSTSLLHADGHTGVTSGSVGSSRGSGPASRTRSVRRLAEQPKSPVKQVPVQPTDPPVQLVWPSGSCLLVAVEFPEVTDLASG